MNLESTEFVKNKIWFDIARCILPDILAFYESIEGQREFEEWKKQREAEQEK